MQQKNSVKNYKTNKLEEVSLASIIKLNLNDDILKKIQYLCQKISKDEWSGILFYDVKEGSIKNPASLVLEIKDILPLDKGTSVFTSYDIGEEYVDYLMEDEERLSWKMGHIHSHNSMNVFFSTTDVEELHDNSDCHNFYLSLIVNNFMEFEAKVSYIVKAVTTVTTPFMALDENGEEYEIESANLEVVKKKLYMHDCEVVSSIQQVEVSEDFQAKVTGIIEKAKPKFVPKTYNQNHKKNSMQQRGGSSRVLPIKPEPKFTFPKEDFLGSLTLTEELVITLLRNTNPPDEIVCEVEDALVEAIIANDGIIEPLEFSESFIKNFIPVYSKIFESDADNVELLLNTIEEAIQILEEYEQTYFFLESLLVGLRSFGFKIESIKVS